MRFPCLVVFAVFVAINEVISVPVADAKTSTAKQDPAAIKKEIIDKVRDALSTGDGKQALDEILANKNNKDDEKNVEVVLDVKDQQGKQIDSVPLAKKSVQNEKEDELRNAIVDNVKDALDKGEGKAVIQQILGEKADEKADLGSKKGIPAAIEDELKQDVDTTKPDIQEDDTTKPDTHEDEERFHDNDNDLAEGGNDPTISSDETSDEVADDTDPGYFVSEPFASDEDQENDDALDEDTDMEPAGLDGDTDTTGIADTESHDTLIGDDPANDDPANMPADDGNDDTLNDDANADPADVNDAADDSDTSKNNDKSNDETKADAKKGYRKSFTEDKTDKDGTEKAKKKAKPADVKDEAAASNPKADSADPTETKSEPETETAPNPAIPNSKDAKSASNVVPAASPAKANDETKAKDREEKGTVLE